MNFAATQEFQSLRGTMQEAFQSVQALQSGPQDVVRGLWNARAGLKHIRQNARDLISKIGSSSQPLPEEHVEGLVACQDNMRDVYATAKKISWPLRLLILGNIEAAFRDLEGLRWAILEHNADLEKGPSQILRTPSEIDEFFSSI